VYRYSHAEGDRSGVVWLAAVEAGGWERREISGPTGTKFDNVELVEVDGDEDPDVVTTEQIEQLGVVWYENPSTGTAIVAPPLHAMRVRDPRVEGCAA
jgi:hypothetical protein